eukprot:gene19402-24566_t
MSKQTVATARRKARVRRAIKAVANGRARLSVHRTGKQIYAQVIDDAKGLTLASASSMDKDIRADIKSGANVEAAAQIGKIIAERAIKAGVKEVVFDRGAYMYHGRVKALAEAAREDRGMREASPASRMSHLGSRSIPGRSSERRATIGTVRASKRKTWRENLVIAIAKS